MKSVDQVGTLYALKSGVVPRGGVAQITIGRQHALHRVEAALAGVQSSRPARLDLIQGDYGEGKSHLLEIAREEALGAGFAVSKFAVNFDTTILHQPKLLLRAITRSLELPDRAGRGLETILRNLIASPNFLERTRVLYVESCSVSVRNVNFSYSIWPSGLFAAASRPALAPIVSRWLTGDAVLIRTVRPCIAAVCAPPPYLAISAFYLPDIISGLARSLRALGYGGLVLLVDELENALSHACTRNQRRAAVTLLGSLANRTSPLYILGAVTAAAQVALRADLSWTFGDWTSRLQSVLARFDDDSLLRVPELTRDEMLRLGGRVAVLHESAFDWRASPAFLQETLSQLVDHTRVHRLPIRSFLRTLVDELDIHEQATRYAGGSDVRVV